MENENLDLKKSLEYIGFSEKEVVVYLALLSLGKGTVTEISRKAGINRPTGYHVLASLSAKELVKVSGKEPKQEYVAESPNQIENLLQKKTEEDQRFISEARKIIPELKSIHNVSDRPKVFFYEGEEGLERKSHDKEEMREMAFVPKDKYYFSPEINIYDNKVMIASWREKLGIIIESTEIADAMKKIYELSWAEAKRLDKEF
jgi:sugar-specific transcriptional regulator TrmB